MNELIQKGIKVRHFNISMPEAQLRDDVDDLLKLLPKVLLPNGKLFITGNTNEEIFLELAEIYAREAGFKTRRLRNITDVRQAKTYYERWYLNPKRLQDLPDYLRPSKRTATMALKRLEITFPLKLAFPNEGKRGDVKARRRNWP